MYTTPEILGGGKGVRSEAKKRSEWVKVKSVEGLYLKTSTGGYFTRYSLNGKRTFRSLETDVLTVAKLRHKKRQAETESERQRGASLSLDFRTLGQLAAEVLARVMASDRKDGSKRATEDQVNRLRENWRRGKFDSFHARHVTHDVLFELREHLRTAARVRTSRRWNTGKCREKPGFAASVVNQTMWCLRQMLEVAVEKQVMIENPFATTGALRERVLLRARSRRKELPRREDVEAMFAEMRRVPKDPSLSDLEGEPAWHQGHRIGLMAYRVSRAQWTADHAEFLALTGCRLEEANAARLDDDKGDQLFIRGTKTESSERFIPVHRKLRELLDRLSAASTDGRFLKVQHSLAPMARACGRLGIAKLTHHHMRHYYATICIESGVDIPTVSRWLGHADGGALCMKTYGHLRDEHSQMMGRKVDFTPKTAIPAAGRDSIMTGNSVRGMSV
jgi:integrase